MIDFRMNHGTSQLKDILRHSGDTLDSKEFENRVLSQRNQNIADNTTSINTISPVEDNEEEIVETSNFNMLTQIYKRTNSDNNDDSFEKENNSISLKENNS